MAATASPLPPPPGRLRRAAEAASAGVVNTFLEALSATARTLPLARPGAHGVELDADLCYHEDSPTHRLDVYRPVHRPGPWPVVFYVHGGGFQTLSKDTHWIMALVFARFGYMVVNIDYRLAPRHPFPAALEDTCRAWAWTVRNIGALGGDLDRIALAGESAGANLVTSLALVLAGLVPAPWASEAHDLGVMPRAVMPFCGMLQVSDPHRFGARRAVPGWVQAALRHTSRGYLQRDDHGDHQDLADPVVALERGVPLVHPLPPFFAAVGTRDPLLDDTRRLRKALADLNVPCEARYYPGGIHAFHAFVWDPSARRCWRDALAFLERATRARADAP